jgi:hypothetical protein
MKKRVAQISQRFGIMLMLASLMTSLIVRVPVTFAEGGRVTDDKQFTKRSDDQLSAEVNPAAQSRLKKAFGQLPTSFEANRGQTDPAVRFFSRGAGYTLFLTPTEAVWRLRNEDFRSQISDFRFQGTNPQSSVLRMKLVGANPAPQIVGEDQLPGRSNYLRGNDPRKWQKNVPHYAKVRYTEVYAGVDMIYYGNQQQLEYDFIVAPGADPKVIALDFEGADDLHLDREGNLVLRAGAGEVVQHAPVIYQETDGERQTVSGHYVIKDKHAVGFEVGAYDPHRALMIDPVVQYSTYLGGKDLDGANGIAVDTAGNAYVTGRTSSVDFPDDNGFDATLGGPSDAFVTKFTTDGSALIYSTQIGGFLDDQGNAIAVTKDGLACITGLTGDDDPGATVNDFPVTANAFQNRGDTAKRKRDAFVTVFNANGDDLVYSSFFGGTETRTGSSADEGNGIAVDNTGKVYIAGKTRSFDLPIKNAFQTLLRPSAAAFIAKFNPQASTGAASLLYASYFGCHSGLGVDDEANAIAVDKFGIAYIVGRSRFNQFFPSKSPSSLPPFQKRDPGGTSAFIAKFDCAASGNSSLTYATLLGGSDDDNATAVAVDNQQRTYITGTTRSSDFPLKNPFDTSVADLEGFVAKMNADGTALFYSSFLGGAGVDAASGIAVDAQGNAYVVGEVDSATDFPILNAFQPNKGAGIDAFVAKISAVSSTSVSPKILFNSFLGGNGNDIGTAIALGPKRSVLMTGFAGTNFPTTPGAFQKDDPPGFDAFVTKIAEVNADTVGTFSPSDVTFRLRNFNTAGPPNITVGPGFNQAGDLPVTGDFDGDGTDTTGVFRPANGAFILSDRIDGSPTSVFFFGQPGDLPIAGDWNGDGKDTVGVFRPSAGKFFLRNSNTAGAADITVTFGAVGDIPLAGDWDGDGDDTIGIYRTSNHTFFLRNKFNLGADIVVAFGINGDVPLTGDWDGNGTDTIGVFRDSNHKFILRNVNTGPAVLNFDFGATGDTPLAGDWDGLSQFLPPNLGVNDPAQGSSRVDQAQQFTTTCSDPDGWRNIHTIDFRISKPDAQGNLIIALWAQFDQNRNRIRLYDPDTQTWSEGIPGSTDVLENRFVKLRLSGAMVKGSGPTGSSVQVLWNVVFMEAAVMEGYKQYLRIEDDAGFSTGFDEVGEWSVSP